MKLNHLSKMINGWFVGDFEPSIFKTREFEVAVKKYKKGDYEKSHYHKIATEITVIVSGMVEMNKVKYSEGDIIVIEPNESTDFLALTDCITTVVKVPSVINDKYINNEE
jgi:quercetin dioxygenase-like cupin family protein